MTRLRIPTRLTIVLMATASLAHAAGAPVIPLGTGTYVAASYKPCKDAPLAGVVDYDGVGFGGPHASDCHSTVLSHKGRTWKLDTECRALGDGTPTTPTRQASVVRVESPTSFVLIRGDDSTGYALCPTFH